MTFVEEKAEEYNIQKDNLIFQYLARKTRAADRGSKSRRSLGNLYALLVLAEDYIEGKTSRFSDLLSRMRALPFGSKLQNHPLDNRLNDEFSRQMGVNGNLLPVKVTTIGDQKARTISTDLLSYNESNPKMVANFIISVIRTYIDLITKKQSNELNDIQSINTIESLIAFFENSFLPNSDARLFEVASYVLLAEHYRNQTILIGPSEDQLERKQLTLFRTGRTNANDGGIDFVLQPLGRFFQVTETLDFKKYFLDFEKVNRYPLSFVIKVEKEKSLVKTKIISDAERSNQYSNKKISLYKALFEEIFTIQDLRQISHKLQMTAVDRVKSELSLQFQLEYGLLD